MGDAVGETSSRSTVSAPLLGVTKPGLGCQQVLVGKAQLLENIVKSC